MLFLIKDHGVPISVEVIWLCLTNAIKAKDTPIFLLLIISHQTLTFKTNSPINCFRVHQHTLLELPIMKCFQQCNDFFWIIIQYFSSTLFLLKQIHLLFLLYTSSFRTVAFIVSHSTSISTHKYLIFFSKLNNVSWKNICFVII